MMHRGSMEVKESILKGEKQKFPLKLLHKYFDDRIESVGHLPAVVSEDDEYRLTFIELYDASNRCGRAIYNTLKPKKVHDFNEFGDWIVGIYMKPSYRAIITMLAIWKCGAAYLPLNYEFPQRLKAILNEAKPQLIIADEEFTTSRNRDIFGDFKVLSYKDLRDSSRRFSSKYIVDEKTLTRGQQDNLLMVLYSSEVLVPPKGTRIHNSCCQQRLEWQWLKFPFYDEFHCLSHNAIFHIDHFAEIWGTLLQKRTIVLMKDENRFNTDKLINALEKYDIQRFYGLPLKIDRILDKLNEETSNDKKKKKRLMNVDLWISSGDELKFEIAEKFFNYYENDGNHFLANFYGCTETTGDCCYYLMKSLEQIRSLGRIPIGIPNYSSYIYILDETRDTVLKGVTGDIYVSGPIVAANYVNNIKIDAFQDNPFNLIPMYWRMFKTGDYGTVKNGLLYFDGRSATKVRVKDHEVNYLEVEKYINEIVYVEKAVVLPIKDHLVAFITLERFQANISIAIIENDMRKDLPDYAIPEIILSHRIPTKQDGTVDKDLVIKKYLDMTDLKIQTNVDMKIVLDGIPEHKHNMARKVFTILGNNIGSELNASLSATSNFFHIGGSSLNVICSINELCRHGLRIDTEDFLKAKDFQEILDKIEEFEDRPIHISPDFSIDHPPGWRISSVHYDNRHECAAFMAECYHKKHSLIKLDPKLKLENIQRFIEENWTTFVERRFSYAIYDKDDKRIGLALNIDLDEEHFLEMDELEAFQSIFEFRAFVEGDIKSNYVSDAKMMNYMMGTSMSLSPVENVRAIYMMEQHLIKLTIASQFNKIYANVTCPLNVQICKLMLGYKILKEFTANRFVDKNGVRPFKNADDSIIQFILIYDNNKKRW